MKVGQVRFVMRKSIGQYEHEELECVLVPDAEGDEKSAEEMLREARRVVVQNTTSYLNRVKTKSLGGGN